MSIKPGAEAEGEVAEPERAEEPVFIRRRGKREKRQANPAGKAHYEKVKAGINFPDKYV